jgi:primary-amine oxidase
VIPFLRILVAVLIGTVTSATARAAPMHPLDPLTADELAVVGAVLAGSGEFSKNTSFGWVQLREPAKAFVSGYRPGADFPRTAFATAVDYDKKQAFEIAIDVKRRRIASVVALDGRHPGITDDDTERARAIVDGEPAIKAALVRRGLDVPGKVSDASAVQYAALGFEPGLERHPGRLMRVLFGSDQHATNEFSPFLDGLMAIVDLYAGQMIELIDVPGAPTRKVPHDIFDAKVRGAAARAASPPGPARRAPGSVRIDGHAISWQSWQLRFSFNVREGLVLHQVGFTQDNARRSILYRASVAEVVTAYGDPSKFWSWMELFDEGVFGLGYLSMPVRPGREVPANAVVLGAVVPDPANKRFSDRLDDRVYLYERDAGGLMHYRQGDLTFHARATELVIGFFASVGNYVYGLNWVFRQDGSFAFEAELAGEVLTKFVEAKSCGACEALAEGPGPGGASRTFASRGADQHGTLVHPDLVAINHQHWFNLRLDFDIDGTRNAVMENNVPRPSHADGHGDGAADARVLATTHTVFGKAVDAKRHADDETSRSWTIYDPSAATKTRRPVGYTVTPTENTATAFPASREREPVAFTFHHFWVTPFREGQLYPGGTYPNQARRGDADTLYHYANDDEIYNKDIVVWYSLGETHVPKLEDYPVMSNVKLSVGFRPDGFFERNPALGLGKVYDK